MSLNETIQTYLDRLAGMGWPVAEKLAPGIAPDEVDARLRELGLSPDPELHAFWSAMNGIVEGDFTLDQMQIFPGYYPLSIAEAVTAHQTGTGAVHGRSGEEDWPEHLFPILADGMGDFFTVDLREAGGAGLPVWNHVEGFPPELRYASIRDFFGTATRGVEEGLIFLEEGRYLELDDEGFEDLERELNPDIPREDVE
ncbi:SMI1/KNR4 family protein [Salipiger sp. H15]|uniref:SMI1/KNR4 family protein n=1 Tax=Alloyangia sp. H15 TaxID=3029062 RepID=A0AAU8AHG5_9RHOB